MTGTSPTLAELWDTVQTSGVISLSSVVPVAIVLGTIITAYEFYYKRPELIVDVEPPNAFAMQPHEEGDTQAVLVLLLANVGNNSAEEVQLTITADAFKFINDIDAGSSITSNYDPPQAVMEIRGGKKTAFVGGGERHDIFLNNIVYEGDVQELYLGKAVFTDGYHQLKYRVACGSHSPRTGSISFKVDNGEVEITGREFPTYRRKIKTCLNGTVERQRTQKLENLDEDDVEIQVEVK